MICRTDGERLLMITQPGATTHVESQLQIVLTEHASWLHPCRADDAQTTRIAPPARRAGSAPLAMEPDERDIDNAVPIICQSVRFANL